MAPQRSTHHDSQRTRPTTTQLCRVAFAGAFFLLLLFGSINPANAASYTFPGNLPMGCTGSAGAYTCTALTLIAGDTLTIGVPTPATLTINGDLNTGGASVNAPGNPSNLRLVVTGMLTAGSGARITADVTAGSVSNVAGGATVNGSITTKTGAIGLGSNTSVSGGITSDSGTVNVGDYADIGGEIKTSGTITLGNYGSLGSNMVGTANAPITVGTYTNIAGAIGTGGAVTVGGHSSALNITSTGDAVTVGTFVTITGTVAASGAVTVGANSQAVNANSTTGALTVGAGAKITGNLGASGAIQIDADAQVNGTITSTAGTISLGARSTISSCVRSASGAVIALTTGAAVNSVCCGSASACTSACVTSTPVPPICQPPSTGPHHLEVRHDTGSGLTCSPSTLIVVACQDAACASAYTGGVTGTLTATGAGMTVNWPNGASFSIPSGSSSTTKDVQVTTVGSVVFGTAGAVPLPAAPSACNFGNPACTFTVADAGFLFDVPNHVSEVTQTVAIRAVRKSDNTAACVPALTGSRSVNFTCVYLNPGLGTLPVRVGGVALNAANDAASVCSSTGRAVNLTFNASGVASTSVQYADVGEVQLNARLAGSGSDAGLVMTGTDSFIAAPASFAFSAISPGPIKAGAAFSAMAAAVNSVGSVTPNFGREAAAQSATLAFTRAQPSGSGASNGVFTGSLGAFSAGVASASNLVWSEVGRGDLSATLSSANYLGSGLSATGTTGNAGAVGRFTPHHFDVVVTPACSIFTYAAQPFSARITAKNGLATPGTTVNYDGTAATTPNFSQAVTLSDAPALGLGSFAGTGALAASLFGAGVANTLTPAYSFTAKLTAAQTLVVRAIDADSVSSAGYAEGSTALRSGRLRLSNAFGSEKSPLALAVQAQYWSGNAWVLNSADNCSVVPAAAVARSGYVDNKGAPTAAWNTTANGIVVAGGNATLTLSAPSPLLTGSVNLALNLGTTAADQSCLAVQPASTGAALPWLRSQNGGCSTAWDRDPSARATFGIFSPETRKILHVRRIF